MRKILVLLAVLFARPVLAQTPIPGPLPAPAPIMPGESRTEIPTSGLIITNQHSEHGVTSISAESSNADNHMLMFAGANNPLGFITGAQSAKVVGRLVYDFCVPRAGSTTCDETTDPAAPDIVANIAFSYGLVGKVSAVGIGTKATFQATGSIQDMSTNKLVAFDELANISESLGHVKVIAEIPIPLPDFDSVTITKPVTFTTLLKRGKIYRFQLSAALTATTGLTVGDATVDFATFAPFLPQCFIEVKNLSIHIASDTSTLEQTVSYLVLETRWQRCRTSLAR